MAVVPMVNRVGEFVEKVPTGDKVRVDVDYSGRALIPCDPLPGIPYVRSNDRWKCYFPSSDSESAQRKVVHSDKGRTQSRLMGSS